MLGTRTIDLQGIRICIGIRSVQAGMDELDKAILAELQSDARKTNRDVAASVGVSPTTALDRTRALRQRGVIRGAILDVDLAEIGRPVQALIAIRVRPPHGATSRVSATGSARSPTPWASM
ncbi:hypothetical protein GCM10027612_11360 [Microbispora bryophytorum subsp. camponoti]